MIGMKVDTAGHAFLDNKKKTITVHGDLCDTKPMYSS